MNRTSVYATARYESTTDTFRLADLSVYKMSFDQRLTSNDTTYQFGSVSYLQNDSIAPGSPYSGIQPVTVSLDPKWVRLQQHDAHMILWFLAKPEMDDTDTLQTPTASFMQYPVLPRVLNVGKTYQVYRPGTENFYSGVYRRFQVRPDTVWTDNYGTINGIMLETVHALSAVNDTFHFTAVVDSHGIAVTQNVLMSSIFVEKTTVPADTLVMINITRRIVDFASPEETEPLSYYMQEVLANGLEPIHRFPVGKGSTRTD